MSEIKAYVESIFDELVAIRRDIHAHPEVGMTEVRTSALIRAELEKMGMDEVQSPLPTAVVGLLHGGKGPGKCVALRAVTSTDGMTADWVHLPYDFLAAVSNEIINRVRGVNRVVYDISSKPPATIEWE